MLNTQKNKTDSYYLRYIDGKFIIQIQKSFAKPQSITIKRDNKLNFRCNFGQLLHYFILVKVHIISDKNVRVISLKLNKSCPKLHRKFSLLSRFISFCLPNVLAFTPR